MPKGYPRTACRGCDRPLVECGSLSRRGLCDDCGTARREANLVCLVTQTGPYYDHWEARLFMAMHRRVLARARRGS